MNNIFTISNGLSFLRLLLSIPLYFSIIGNNYSAAVIICLLAYLTDLGDGYLARKLNQITEFGKIIDPLSDKVFVFVFVITLFIQGRIPFWFFAVIASRDLLILLGGLFMASKVKKIPASNLFGKGAVLLIGITLLANISNFFPEEILILLMAASTIGVLLSFGVYLKNFIVSFKS